MEIGWTTAVVLALGSALMLAALHLLAPKIRRLPSVPEHVTASFAGGIAVSYVFLHLLPELNEGSRRVREVLGEEESGRSPLLGLEIFLVALLGFVVFYGLERLAQRKVDDDVGIFRVHLASFLIYNAIIGYTLPLNWRTSVPFAILFTVAMGLHFVLTDRGLEEHYGGRFDRWPPRVMLALALILGWLLAALFVPTSGVFVSLLTALLAGGILLNVFKEEIPSTRRSHFGWFVAGLAGYALLLGIVTATGERAREPEGQPESSTPGSVHLLTGAGPAPARVGGDNPRLPRE